MSDDDEAHTIPLQDQRVFGAGVRRQRINFVPSASAVVEADSMAASRNSSVANRYLSTVLQSKPSHLGALEDTPSHTRESTQDDTDGVSQSFLDQASTQTICEICRLPVEKGWPNPGPTSEKPATAHATSIAHQYCLEASKPPSHLDRGHVGFKYLSSYGWDADTKIGLGATGQGIPAPIKGVMKNDTVGIGLVLDKNANARPTKPKRLNAKEARKMEARQKRSRAKMEELFYGSGDMQRYLS